MRSSGRDRESVVGSKTVDGVHKEQRKANIRLAIILGLIAFGFYLLMIFVNPL